MRSGKSKPGFSKYTNLPVRLMNRLDEKLPRRTLKGTVGQTFLLHKLLPLLKVPYYNINGDMDYQTNYELACEYFEQVNAPEKEMFVMKDATHGLLESRPKEFSEFVHKIAET